MTVLASVFGYLIGSIPTAVWLARARGVDLRAGGTGNPGANNARRLGGLGLAVPILAVEVTKGWAAVALGFSVVGEQGAAAAAIAAVAGNVYNVWLGFHGGKGLAITAGVLLGMWPLMLPIALAVLILTSAATRSTGKGTLTTLALLILGGLVWERVGLESGWGVDDPALLILAAAGISLIMTRKHWLDARRSVRTHARP